MLHQIIVMMLWVCVLTVFSVSSTLFGRFCGCMSALADEQPHPRELALSNECGEDAFFPVAHRSSAAAASLPWPRLAWRPGLGNRETFTAAHAQE